MYSGDRPNLESVRVNAQRLNEIVEHTVEYTYFIEARLQAAIRTMLKIKNHIYDSPETVSPQQIAQDFLNTLKSNMGVSNEP